MDEGIKSSLYICECGHFKDKHDYLGCIVGSCWCEIYKAKW